MIGKILGNRYEIIEQLGGGGMALVYKAKCTLLNRIVTVKVLRPEFTSDQEFVDRFRREAQSVAKLSHPNIVSVYDVGEEDGIYYIIMEYIDGRTLKEVIMEKGKLPVNEAVQISEQICQGIGHAHENGIVHRDIKPHNILITKSGLVKVTDFGIARAVTAATVTHTGNIIGSVHYFSPEQAKGEDAGVRSDIYSAGVVLYEMLTGKVPFDGETPISVAIKHIQEKPVPPSHIERDISPELERVVMRAMEKDPILRYQTAFEMASDLKTVLEGRISNQTRVMPLDEFATKVLPAEALAKELGKSVPDQAQPAKKKKLKPKAKAAIIGGILLLLILAFFGIRNYLIVPDVTVPDVTKMSFADANRTLKDRGLSGHITDYEFSADVPKDRVVDTSPKPGDKVKKGRVISLTVSKGVKMAAVPDVRKKTLTDAQYELKDAGFKVSTIYEYNNDLPKDTVIDQDPSQDTNSPIGSVVTLRVSKGQQVIVPDLTGKTLDDAKTILQKYGYDLDSNVTRKSSNDYVKDQIIDQNPKPGSPLDQGKTVSVVVSDGPGPATNKTPKTANVQVTVTDSQPQEIVIYVTDDTGRSEVYRKVLQSGQTVVVPVSYYGKGIAEVYQAGKQTQTLPLP